MSVDRTRAYNRVDVRTTMHKDINGQVTNDRRVLTER